MLLENRHISEESMALMALQRPFDQLFDFGFTRKSFLTTEDCLYLIQCYKEISCKGEIMLLGFEKRADEIW